MRRAAAGLRDGGIEVESETVRGTPAAEILIAAARTDVAAIVIATHGRGGIVRWALGSVADKVMRQAPVPTLLIRPPQAGASQPAVKFERLLVPLDGSVTAEGAVGSSATLATATGAAVTLLRVVPYLTMMMDWGSGYVPDLTSLMRRWH